MGEPLISVLMPVRDFGPYTLDAVNSVLQQTHRNIELVIVGNDEVTRLLRKLPDDPRILGVAREAAGIVGALNTGLATCTGEYIARMDDDDVCEPHRLATQLEFLQQHPHLSLVGAQVRFFTEGAQVGAGNQRYEQWLNGLTTPGQIDTACMIESALPHPTFFAHRDTWRQLAPYRDTGWPEDYDLVLRCWLAGMQMGKPDGVLLRWREHRNRLSRTDERYSREAFVKARVWALMHSGQGQALAAGQSVWICGTGRSARYWHDELQCYGVTVRGFVDIDHEKRKTSKRHLPVITYDELAGCWNDALVVSVISEPDARTKLADWLREHSRASSRHYLIAG